MNTLKNDIDDLKINSLNTSDNAGIVNDGSAKGGLSASAAAELFLAVLVFAGFSLIISFILINGAVENKRSSIEESKNAAPSQAQVDFMDKYGITSIEDSPIVAPVTINHYREAFDSDGERPYEYSIVYVKDDVKHDGTIDVSVDGEVTIWDDNGAKLRPVTIDEDNKS